MLERALQKAVLFVRLSVCHTHNPYLNGSKYQNIFYTIRYSDVYIFETKFCSREFRDSPQTSALNVGTPCQGCRKQ